jgi:hypothetical protein
LIFSLVPFYKIFHRDVQHMKNILHPDQITDTEYTVFSIIT